MIGRAGGMGRWRACGGIVPACGIAIALLVGPASLRAQPELEEAPGRILGTVKAADDGEPLPYANIQVYRLVSPSDSTGYRVTGVFAAPPEGRYEVSLPPGLYRVQASYVSCQPSERRGVSVVSGRSEVVNLQLARTVLAIAPITVTAKRVRDTEAAVLAQQREAAAVADAISSEQIKKGTDGSAAEALQRVSGVSTVDNRYIFVRGLGERYSATLINGSPVGSPEPNKKVVPLDLVPSALLDQVFIQKSYTPDQPGEFGGGTVNIRTRDFPEKRVWSLGVSTGFDAGTTGEDFYEYEGGHTDHFGYDDGTREIPKLIRDMAGDQPVKARGIGSTSGFTSAEIESLGESFNKIWSGEARPAAAPYGVTLALGDRFDVLGRPLGIMVGGVLKNGYACDEHEEKAYEPGVGDTLEPRTQYDVTTSTSKTQLGLLGNVGWQPEAHTTVKLTSFFNRSAEDEYRVYEGLNTDHGVTLRDTRLRFLAREIWSSQLEAHHVLPLLEGAALDWRMTYSRAAMEEPDRREYIYEWRLLSGGDEDEEETSGDPEGQWELSTRSASQGLTRMFGELTEEERGAGFDLTLPLPLGDGLESRLRLGYQQSLKSRDVAYRRFAYLPPTSGWNRAMPPESLLTDRRIGGTPRTFRLTELTRATDAYTAEFNVYARYFIVDIPIAARLRSVVGLRSESWLQAASTFDPFVPDGEIIAARLEETDLLPSLNLTYALGPAMNLRAGYSQTISRPDLRELTPFELSQYESGWNMRGNPELKRAKLRNYDLRWESYPAPQELLAASLFYKELIDPIEKTLRIAGSQLREVPENGDGGHLLGAELEARVALARVSRRLAGLALAGNLTLVQSETRLSKDGIQTSQERPLAGQSPYLVNAMLFYQPEGRWYSGSLLYNLAGERLDGVGAMGMPDIYEEPRGTLDAAVNLRWGRTGIKLAAENLTDEESLFTQNGFVVRRSQKGRSFGLSISRGG